MIRSSTLDIARHCGLASELARKYPGAGRSALMSSCYHATLACKDTGELSEEARARYVRLLPEEREKIETWYAPLDLELNGDPEWRSPECPPSLEKGTLDYGAAHKEVAFGIDADMVPLDHGDDGCLIQGHADMLWIHGDVAYVGDLKRSAWTIYGRDPDIPQLLSYGFMAAAKFNVGHFCCGIWAAEEGFWNWGPLHELMDDNTDLLWEMLVAAASNDSGEAVTGNHCLHCYNRSHCPEWQIPLGEAYDVLRQVRQGELHDSDVEKLLLLCKRAEEAAEMARAEVKTYVSQHYPTGFKSSDGKNAYRGRITRGREHVSVSELRAGLGEKAEHFIRRSPSYLRWSWGMK